MKKKSVNSRMAAIWFMLAALLMGELFFFTWCRVQYIQTGYEISEEMGKQSQLIKLQNKLKIEFAHLKSPERIAKIASEQLGLVVPKPDQMITIP